MRIPIIQADKPLAVIRDPSAGQGWRARGAAATEAQNLAGTIAKHQAVLQEKERIAQDALTAIETDNSMRKEFAGMVESFQGRTDPKNFDPSRQKASEEIKAKYFPKNGSKELQIAFGRSYNQYDSNSSTQVSRIKFRVMEENGRIAIGESLDNYADQYAAATDDDTKAFILKQAELEITKAVNSNLVNRVWGADQIRNFEAKAEATEDLNAITAAKNFIIDNPTLADAKSLKAMPFWDKVPDDKKPELIKTADRSRKAAESEFKAKKEASLKILHEADDEDIYSLIKNKEFAKASTMIDNSSLPPHEQNSWRSSLRNWENVGGKEKHPTEVTDPLMYAMVATMVYNNPKGITRGEIFKLVGKGKDGGLSAIHAEHFSDELKKQLEVKPTPKDGVRSKEISSGLNLLKQHHGYGTFGDDYIGDLKYQKTMEEFLRWTEANPDKDPSEKLEKILTPIKEEHTKNIIERAWNYFFDVTPEPTPALPEDTMVRTGLLPKADGQTRQQAIDILTNAGKLVNDETIKQVMDQLK